VRLRQLFAFAATVFINFHVFIIDCILHITSSITCNTYQTTHTHISLYIVCSARWMDDGTIASHPHARTSYTVHCTLSSVVVVANLKPEPEPEPLIGNANAGTQHAALTQATHGIAYMYVCGGM
jgi:hypothetical protein